MRRSLEGVMKLFKQLLTAVFTLCLLSAGALASEPQGGDKQRPPKQEKEVPKTEKRDPPPSNNSGGGNRGGNDNKPRGKPF